MALKNLESVQNVLEIYRKNKYSFELADNFKCLLCSQILLVPVQTNCGCRYCKECLDQYLKIGNKKCLGAECNDIESCVPDNAITKEIRKMEVNCLYNGCDHIAEIKDMDKHLSSCEFQLIECPQCNESYAKIDLDNHLKETCKMRNVQCEYCKETMTVSDIQEIHYNIDKEGLCPKYVTTCPYKCDVNVPVNLMDHRNQCKKKPIFCPYYKYGCMILLSKENIDNHIKEDASSHLMILMNEIEKVGSECINLKSDIKTATQERDLMQFELREYKLQLNRLVEQVKLSESTVQNSDSSTLKSMSNQVIFRNGVYIWKIPNFPSKKYDAERGGRISITSEPFYTSEFGYKMSMKVYPAGDGVGKSTHLSVFFTIMRGDFDDLLQWPFKNKVTLSILDQQNKIADHLDTFKPDPRSSCYQKPTDEYNIASGSPKFISLDNLRDNYLYKDTIFLKILVLN